MLNLPRKKHKYLTLLINVLSLRTLNIWEINRDLNNGDHHRHSIRLRLSV